jgi:hypothetical protein
MAHMISGIGNPIVAVYARCYLCRVGRGVSNRIKNKQYLLQNFHRFLNSYHHVSGHATNNFISDRNSSSSAAASRPNSPSKRCPCRCTRPCSPQPWTTCCRRWRTTLPTPSSTTSRRSARITATGTPRPVPSRHSPPSFSSLILNTMMSAFKPSCISKRALQFMEMMEQCLDQGIPLYSLLRTLGLCVSVAPPPLDHRRQILNAAWRHITALKEVEEYVACAEPWILYVVKYFSVGDADGAAATLHSFVSAPRDQHDPGRHHRARRTGQELRAVLPPAEERSREHRPQHTRLRSAARDGIVLKLTLDTV